MFDFSKMRELLIVSALVVSQIAAFSQLNCPKSAASSLPTKHKAKSVLSAKSYRSTVDHSPGADLFNNGSSYVPSGLTKEQYAKIKAEEQQELKKKDFGSWGPRFSKSDRPDGDWMVVPSLWTSGFTSDSRGAQPSPQGNAKQQELKKKPILTVLQLKNILPVYALASFLLEIFLSATFLFHKKEMTSMIVIAMTKLKRGNDALLLSTSLMAKIIATKLVLATLLVKPLELMIEKCNRKFLWSPRRTIVYSMIGSVGALSLWNVLIMGCKIAFS